MLIGLTGSMGSGKTTAIDLIKEFVDRRYQVVKFAGPLYDMQEFIYRRIASVHPKPKDFVKDRKLLQWLGTEWGRSISKDLWADIWKEEVAHNSSSHTPSICDDVRFDNEAELVHSLGGVVIKIINPDALKNITTANGFSNHVSEIGIKLHNIDFVVVNDGTLAQYQERLLSTVKQARAYLNNKLASKKV